MKKQLNKPIFLYGLGDKKSDYKSLEKYFVIPKIDWNVPKVLLPKKIDTLIGFSMGGYLACMHALKHKIKTLILCSLPPGLETLENIKANRIIFMVGSKEKWVIEDIERTSKTCDSKNPRIIIVSNAKHKIDKIYLDKLLEIINQ